MSYAEAFGGYVFYGNCDYFILFYHGDSSDKLLPKFQKSGHKSTLMPVRFMAANVISEEVLFVTFQVLTKGSKALP